MSRPLLNGRPFGRYQLSPRLKLVTEQISGALTSSVGVFVKCGSSHEVKSLRGATHLAEHLFFKGTSRHSAEEISQVIERSGGDINAYTDREFTCFHTWVASTETFSAFSLILEMLFDSIFDEGEFKKEKEVVLQELRGYEESADDEFLDALLEVPWKGHPLGLRIAGRANEVKKIEHEDVVGHIKDTFLKSEIVISIVSPHAPDKVHREVKKALRTAEDHTWGKSLSSRHLRHSITKKLPSHAGLSQRSSLRSFSGDQVQCAFIYPSVPIEHRDEDSWTALISLMGLGSSSYLFRELRENNALVYTTYATTMNFAKAGLSYGYFSTQRKNFFEALHASAGVCGFFSKGLSAADLDFVKSSLRGSLLMSFEGVNNRMESLGRQEILCGHVSSLKNALSQIDALSHTSMRRVTKVLSQTPCFFALGSVSGRDLAKVKRVWKDGFNSKA